MKYLITIDLDGTLLEDDKKVSQKTIDTIKKLKDLGHLIVIATGRAIHGAVYYHDLLNLDTPLITDNGSLLSNPSDDSFKKVRKTIPLDIFKDMFENTKQYLLGASVNMDYTTYSLNYNKYFELSFNGFEPKEVVEMDLSKITFEPMNMSVYIDSKNRKEFEAYFKGKSIHARYWGDHEGQSFYDIHRRDVSKASAIQDVMDYYNIGHENLITVGDGPNDTEMLTLSPNGTAMVNANEIVKTYATYITKLDNNNSGVAKHLQTFFNL